MPSAQQGVTAAARRELRFEAVGVTDVGRQRKHNEDHVLLRPELDLFVVADGMGGHNAGDIASRLATTSLRNFYEATETGPIPSDVLGADYDALAEHARRLAAAIQKANRDVFEISSTYRQHHGMGSTVVAAYLERQGGLMHVGHVGDSRCYRMREGKLELLTHDHSLINDALALKPDLTPEELARLPKNIITRALGMREEVKVDIRSEAVRAGDIFLLCSDGLSGMISEADIATVLKDSDDLREACELLVTLANDNGGTDNITALLVRINADDAEGAISSRGQNLGPPPSGPQPPVPPSAPTPPTAPTPPEPPKPPSKPMAKAATPALTRQTATAKKTGNESNVFVGTHETETAKLSEILPNEILESLEAGEEVSLAGSFADTVVDSSPPSDRAVALKAAVRASPLATSTPPRQARPAPAPAPVEDAPSLEIEGLVEEGTVDAESSDSVARCKECDAELEVGNHFCVECGARI